MNTLYVAGKMRGLWHLGFHHFDRAAKMLEDRGFYVINPAEMDRELGVNENDPNTYHLSGSWQECMRRDFKAILAHADGIALMPTWVDSEGARAERRLCETIGLPVYHVDADRDLLERELVLGISGYARAGKDTLAQMFVDHHGFRRRGFADSLKDFLYLLNPSVHAWPQLQWLIDEMGWERAKEHPEVRPLLQRLGTDAGRKVMGESIWVDTLFNSNTHPRLVVADVRFPNEAEAIKKRGGHIIRVNRPDHGPANAHVSETAMDSWDFDFTVGNDGEIEDLLGPADYIMDKLGSPRQAEFPPEAWTDIKRGVK